MSRVSIYTESVEIAEAGGVAARRFVTFAGEYAAADGDTVLGVARAAGVEGKVAPVDVIGRIEVETTAAAIAVGDAVMSDTEGKALAHTGSSYIAGYALTAVPAAGGIVTIARGI